jgi:hypothetical protein
VDTGIRTLELLKDRTRGARKERLVVVGSPCLSVEVYYERSAMGWVNCGSEGKAAAFAVVPPRVPMGGFAGYLFGMMARRYAGTRKGAGAHGVSGPIFPAEGMENMAVLRDERRFTAKVFRLVLVARSHRYRSCNDWKLCLQSALSGCNERLNTQ